MGDARAGEEKTWEGGKAMRAASLIAPDSRQSSSEEAEA